MVALSPDLTTSGAQGWQLDSLYDAAKYLGKVPAPGKWPEILLMLGKSHFELGNYSRAIEVWRSLINDFSTIFALYSKLEEIGCAPNESDSGGKMFVLAIKSLLYGQLADSYQCVEKIPDAIRTVEEWIREFPEQLGTYERMSRIYAATCDPVQAYTWLRKEVDRNPAVGEDPNRSLALQLGVLASDRIDSRRALRLEAEKDPDGLALIRQVIALQWPTLMRLPDDLQDEWVHGVWGRVRSPLPLQKRCRDLVRSVTFVLEAQLRRVIFEAFGSETSLGLHTPWLGKDAELLRSYLNGEARMGLGQMFGILKRAYSPDKSVELSSLRTWIEHRYPRIAVGVRKSSKIVSIRNRASHSQDEPITEEEADLVYGFCLRTLEALHPPKLPQPTQL
jgi:tetratricopeptide (TPR) repeat protein